MSSLARSESSSDDVYALAARATELETTLVAHERDLAKAKADLAEFGHRYRQAVGKLHDELDDLERAIEEAEASQVAEPSADEGATQAPSSGKPRLEPAPRYTSDAVRKLFRDVARTIHPDLARDDAARGRRHALMVEANKAYALGDEHRLRSILHAWENSPEVVVGEDPDAARLRVIRRIALIEQQIAAAGSELAELHESPLWKLKAMVDAAAANGKNLVASMIGQLKRDIMIARNRLDAIQWRP